MTIRMINTPEGFVDVESQEAHALRNPAQSLSTPPSTRVHTGAVRYTAGDTEAVQQGFARYQHSSGGTEGGSVMQTLQRVNGHMTVELVPGVSGTRTHVALAVKEGIVRQTGSGTYEDVKSPTGQQVTLASVEGSQQQPSAQSSEVFTPADDALWGQALAGVPGHAVDSAVAGIANAVANGTDMDSVVRRLVQNTGMNPAEAAQRIEQAAQVQEAALERAMAQAGLQGEQLQAFYDAARANPARLTDALMHLVHGRDASRFIAWGREHAGNTERRASSNRNPQGQNVAAPVFDEATFRAAGFETSHTRAGVLMVKPAGTNGRWVAASDLA